MENELRPYEVTPKTPLAGSAAAEIREEGDDVSRRSFFAFVFNWATIGWVTFSAALGGLGSIIGRFFFPNVLFEPIAKFKAGFVSEYAIGEVDERWKEKFGIWVVRSESEMYALITTCTHLGCTPNWLPSQNKFKCPCHGSGFYRTGVNFEGPAPRPLERAKIYVDAADGQVVIDKSVQFHEERGDWSNPESYLSI